MDCVGVVRGVILGISLTKNDPKLAMAYTHWTNVPEKFIGKTIESISNIKPDQITLNFTDGTKVQILGSVDCKNLGDYTYREAPVLIVN